MGLMSKTGLIAGVQKPIAKNVKKTIVEFPNVAIPAPYVLRPFAGVYNPFPYGCSILCNHPADYEAKDVVKRAKDTWATEGKSLLLPEELAALRASLLQNAVAYEDGEDMVPEELFRRYTDTDSRPMTPAPTLASGGTRGSGRRCVTPDPSQPTREKMHLVLDLRRSHSQDTLSLQGLGVPPSTTVQPPTRTPTPSHSSGFSQKKKIVPRKTPTPRCRSNTDSSPGRNITQKSPKVQIVVPQNTIRAPPEIIIPSDTGESGEEETSKRRGKRRKGKKSSDGSKEPEFQGLPDPRETQVSALDDEIHNQNSQQSMTLVTSGDQSSLTEAKLDPGIIHHTGPLRKSFIDADILKQLQRELNQEVIESEFDPRKKLALEEAFKSRPVGRQKVEGKELRLLKKKMQQPKCSNDKWLTLPRIFSRTSSRFELPLDSRTLNSMTPLEYVHDHIAISSSRKQLYNQVFNRYREEFDDEEMDRRLCGQKVISALGEILGQTLSPDQATYYKKLIGWQETDLLDFRTWCGVSALCERLLGPQFMAVPSRDIDPCHEVEQADFETLPRKLRKLNPDPRLVTILNGIREL